jgi:hypothetical protein
MVMLCCESPDCVLAATNLSVFQTTDGGDRHSDLHYQQEDGSSCLEEEYCPSRNANNENKRVHFGPTKVFLLKRRSNRVPMSSLWYSRPEFHSFEESLKSDAKEAARNSKIQGTDKAIDRSFKKCVVSGACLLDEDSSIKTVALFICQADDGMLTTTTGGLERFLSKRVYTDKRLRRAMLFKCIFNDLKKSDDGDAEMKAAFIRDASERISRPSTLYARCIARSTAESASC